MQSVDRQRILKLLRIYRSASRSIRSAGYTVEVPWSLGGRGKMGRAATTRLVAVGGLLSAVRATDMATDLVLAKKFFASFCILSDAGDVTACNFSVG